MFLALPRETTGLAIWPKPNKSVKCLCNLNLLLLFFLKGSNFLSLQTYGLTKPHRTSPLVWEGCEGPYTVVGGFSDLSALVKRDYDPNHTC